MPMPIVMASPRYTNIILKFLILRENISMLKDSLKPSTYKKREDIRTSRLTLLRPAIFILPMCQSRHTSSSLGQILFYRRVFTVTRLFREARKNSLEHQYAH